jgi:HAD superfamily hydrolase (TIGR01549 family)
VILLIEAILFDLDGTLLDVDMDDFLDRYLLKLSTHLNYADPERFAKNIWASTGAMVKNTDPALTNEDAFLQHFFKWIEQPQNEVMQLITDFYQHVFPSLQADAGPFPHTQTAVNAARKLQCPLVLATNPIFPLAAIKHRLTWAGLAAEDFALITAYENMHFTKPNPQYYREIASKLNVNPHNCIMVGNDIMFDIQPAKEAGFKTYFVDETAGGFNQAESSGRLQDLVIYLDSINLSRVEEDGHASQQK